MNDEAAPIWASPPSIPSIGDVVWIKARVHLICDTHGRHECYLRVIEIVPKLYPQLWVVTSDLRLTPQPVGYG
jgi:hypothetical protein